MSAPDVFACLADLGAFRTPASDCATTQQVSDLSSGLLLHPGQLHRRNLGVVVGGLLNVWLGTMRNRALPLRRFSNGHEKWAILCQSLVASPTVCSASTPIPWSAQPTSSRLLRHHTTY